VCRRGAGSALLAPWSCRATWAPRSGSRPAPVLPPPVGGVAQQLAAQRRVSARSGLLRAGSAKEMSQESRPRAAAPAACAPGPERRLGPFPQDPEGGQSALAQPPLQLVGGRPWHSRPLPVHPAQLRLQAARRRRPWGRVPAQGPHLGPARAVRSGRAVGRGGPVLEPSVVGQSARATPTTRARPDRRPQRTGPRGPRVDGGGPVQPGDRRPAGDHRTHRREARHQSWTSCASLRAGTITAASSPS
jgi:hypothetical protein